MKTLFVAILAMVLSPIIMVVLSGLYFGLAFWLIGGNGQFGALGEIAGRVAFIVGVPAGAAVGLAFLARTETKKQKYGVLDWITLVISFGLGAILFFAPLYFGFGQVLELLSELPFGIFIGMGFVALVAFIVREIDK